MSRFAGIAAATAALALLASPAAHARDRASEGQAELAKLIEGRVAGEPQSCISTFGNRNFNVIDETALVFESGGTVWVNTTSMPEAIDDDDILVIDRFSASRLCRTDRIELRSRGSGFFSGILILGDFVPYRKADG